MFDYTVIYSNRRTLCAQVKSDGSVIIRVPRRSSKKDIAHFIENHKEWIEKALIKQHERAQSPYRRELSDAEIDILKERAHAQIPPRVKYFSEIMNLTPSAVKISSAVTRFGSCSSKNSLNFSYRLMLYPERAIDYVIVHELAHIKYKNHGKEFYALISEYIPDYKKIESILRQ